MICNQKTIGIGYFFPPRRKDAKVMEKSDKRLQIICTLNFPNFAAFAPLREIFRNLVAASPR
jgi:hypothetical protein